MMLDRHQCRKIASLVFLASTLGSTVLLNQLNYNNLLALTGSIFIGIITAGIWLEVGYRYLVKEATAPLDKLVEKL